MNNSQSVIMKSLQQKYWGLNELNKSQLERAETE